MSTNGGKPIESKMHTNLLHDIDLRQFTILVAGLVCMGAALGFERSLLPRMAVETFNETSALTRLNFVATFGAAKAVANVLAGPVADHFGRKPALVLGFLVGLPVMPYIVYAETWDGIILMNAVFGLSQGLLGSALFFLLIDVMGPARRGIAVGIGECTIYVSTAIVNILAGDLASRFGFRPVPFWVATGFAVAGLISTIPLQDTLDRVKAEQKEHESRRSETKPVMVTMDSDLSGGTYSRPHFPKKPDLSAVLHQSPSLKSILPNGSSFLSLVSSSSSSVDEQTQFNIEASITYEACSKQSVEETDSFSSVEGTDTEEQSPAKHESAVAALGKLLLGNSNFVVLCFAGMIMNFKDGFAWGTFPVFFSEYHKLSDHNTDMLIALYPLCWGFAQAFTGYLSDLYGRKLFALLGSGCCTCAMGVFVMPGILWGPAEGRHKHVVVWLIADVMLGFGTALAYPTFQAGAADEVDPVRRGLGLGFYRFIRDSGYVVGALVCGRLTDDIGYYPTFIIVGVVMGISFLALAFIYKPVHWSESMWKVSKR